MNIHDVNSLPVTRMNAARDAHRARGTSGGKGNTRKLDRTHMTYCPFQDARSRMRAATIDAVEQYRFDVFGHEWEGL